MTTTLTPWLANRAQADAFFARWKEHQPAARAVSQAVERVHDTLLEQAFPDAVPVHARRRLAITTPGVPVLYSHKCTARDGSPRFRILAEPGGTGLSTSEHVEVTRVLLRDLCAQLGWSDACDHADSVLDRILPADASKMDGWHGGLALGLEIADGEPELRVYCNVRHGEITDRWQRFADAMGELADERCEPVFRDFLDRAAPRTIPAGAALALRKGELRGLRFYCGLLESASASALLAAPSDLVESAPQIRQVIDSFEWNFGPLEQQGIVLGYDFVLRDGLVWPAVARYKLDFGCEEASERDRQQVERWAEEQAKSLGLDAGGLRAFFSELDDAFGGWTFQYLSFGFRDGSAELTAYCIPGAAKPVPAPASASASAGLIDSAISGGIARLLGLRDENGGWSDFDTLAGPSTHWVTAYVGVALAATDDSDAREAARAAWRSLRAKRWWSAGWGYNASVPSDADSTIWALRLADAVGAAPSARALRFLSKHVGIEGAISTYGSDGPIRAFTRLAGTSFDGWCGPHACVTAAGAALRALPHRARVLHWLRAQQHVDGHWRSYWWDTSHYATTLAVEALSSADGAGDAERVVRAARWAAADVARRGGAMEAFEQALVIRTLLHSREHHGLAGALARQLANAQLEHGGWTPSARLRIPPPDVAEPDRYSAWREGGRGGGSIQVDRRGTFTTATVLLALQKWRSQETSGR